MMIRYQFFVFSHLPVELTDYLIDGCINRGSSRFGIKVNVIPGQVTVGNLILLLYGKIPVEIQFSMKIFFQLLRFLLSDFVDRSTRFDVFVADFNLHSTRPFLRVEFRMLNTQLCVALALIIDPFFRVESVQSKKFSLNIGIGYARADNCFLRHSSDPAMTLKPIILTLEI